MTFISRRHIRALAPAALVLCAAAAGVASAAAAAERRTAVFAGGCFWCMEPPFDRLDGVVATVSGYTGGHSESPTYEEVTGGGTGHFEAVEVTYDPQKTDFGVLLEAYWRNVDPFDDAGQFCDRGDSYRAAIFVAGEDERALAEAGKKERERQLGRSIVTPVLPRAVFYAAEEYHQDYYRKNPLRYKFYRHRCGRDQRLEEVWGDRP